MVHIYLHLVDFDGKNVGKYTPVQWIGMGVLKLRFEFIPKNRGVDRHLIDPGTGDCWEIHANINQRSVCCCESFFQAFQKLGGGNSNIFYFHPYFGEMIQFD